MKTMNAHKKLGSLLSKAGTNLSLILALLVMSVLFAIMSPHFLTLRNLVNIATYTSINAIMAFGITVAMILAAMDLSQYTVAAVSGMVMALMLRAGLPTGVAIVCALLTGVLLGLLNGVLVSICGVNPIIATLGTQQIYRGFAYLVSNGKNILISNDFLTFIGRGDILGVPVVVLLMIVMFAITAYVLKYTSFGRKIYAIGGNKNASYLSSRWAASSTAPWRARWAAFCSPRRSALRCPPAASAATWTSSPPSFWAASASPAAAARSPARCWAR